MERKIGEVFKFDGEWYQCIKGDICADCTFVKKHCNESPLYEAIGSCNCYRKDATPVIFKKLEKVGEPFTIVGKLYQYYKVFDIDNVCGDGPWCVYNYKAKTLTIEIKQNKEDMEEKELTYEELLHYYHSTVGLWAIDRNPREVHFDWICKNAFQLGIDKILSNSENIEKTLKPFDLQAAKSGKPVCTKDGRKARIICFDSKNDPRRPIVALVEHNDNELLYEYTIEGKDRFSHISTTGTSDLMMLPEKKEGWVNVYRDCDGANITKDDNIYSSKDAAIASAQIIDRDNYVATTIIKWEE